jgi:hypothetical protein
MFLEQIRERFVGQFLKRRHPRAAKLFEFAEPIFIKSDQLTGHDRTFSLLRRTAS